MKWIKCSERMPELGDRVLVFDDKYEIIYMGQVLWFNNMKVFSKDGFPDDLIPIPTHWMLLPSFPPESPIKTNNLKLTQIEMADSLDDCRRCAAVRACCHCGYDNRYPEHLVE